MVPAQKKNKSGLFLSLQAWIAAHVKLPCEERIRLNGICLRVIGSGCVACASAKHTQISLNSRVARVIACTCQTNKLQGIQRRSRAFQETLALSFASQLKAPVTMIRLRCMCWMVRLPSRPGLAKSTLLLPLQLELRQSQIPVAAALPQPGSRNNRSQDQAFETICHPPQPFTRVRNVAKSPWCRYHLPQRNSGVDILIVSRLLDRDADTDPGPYLTPSMRMR